MTILGERVAHQKYLSATLFATTGLWAAGPALAQAVTDGGFETNSLAGWTATGGYRTQGAGAVTPADYSGAANAVTVVGAGNDPLTGVPMVYAGSYAVRVNDSNNNKSVNAISRTFSNYQATDLYLAWSAVMEPFHTSTEAGAFDIIVDQTLGGVTTNAYHAASYNAATGSPSLSSFLAAPGGALYSGWVVEHIHTVIGADYTITLIAADCDAGGHFGYVYLDGFSDTPPAPNAGITPGSSSGGVIGGGGGGGGGGAPVIPDIVTAQGNYVPGLGSVTTRRFDGGTLTAADDAGSFTITGKGGFIDAHGSTSTFTGVFSDDGSAPGHMTIKDDSATGGGVVVFTGLNRHSGGTTVTAGATLSIADARSLGSGALWLIGSPTVAATLRVTGSTTIGNAVWVAGDPVIDVSAGSVATITGVIADDVSGPGDLEKRGNGTLELAAQNTYTGGTIVDAGTLRTTVTNALPVAQAVTVNASGTLDLSSNNQSISTLSGSGSVTLGTANLALTRASGTFSGVISGAGSLSVLGGTEVLTGTNSYAGGTTIASGATLALGAGGTTGLVVGNVTDNGLLVVNRSDNLALSGSLSGIGGLRKLGAGVLTLSGTNTYTGGTTVVAGGLKGDSLAVQGDIVNNAAVEFTQGINGTYGGAMTGTGTLAKSGAGTLSVTGTSSISGPTSLSAGKLLLQGRLGTSTATVGSGATLGGSGTLLGNLLVSAGGILSPGNSPGTLTVAGNVNLDAGSTFVTEIDGRSYSVSGGAGSYDRLALTGAAATFNPGGTISPVLRNISGAATNAFDAVFGDRFTVVTAAALGSGAFAVKQPTSGLPTNSRFDVLYNTASVQLVLTPDNYALLGRSDGWLQDGIAAAAGLDATRPAAGTRNPAAPSLWNGLYGLGRTQLGTAFQQLSGQIHADALQAEAANVDLLRSTADDAGLGAFDDRLRVRGKHLWTQLLGRSSTGTQDDYATRYEDSASGFMSGLNIERERSRYGVAAGYLEGHVTDAIGGRATSQYGSLFLYATRQLSEPWTLNGSLGYAQGRTSTLREQGLSTGTSVAVSHGSFSAVAGDLVLRHRAKLAPNLENGWFVGAKVDSLRYGVVHEQNATDSSLVLDLASGSWESVRSTLGTDLSYALGERTGLQASASWNHLLSGRPVALRAVAMGQASWTTRSVALGEDSLDLGANLSVRLSDSLTFFVGYKGVFDGRHYVSHRGNLGLSLRL